MAAPFRRKHVVKHKPMAPVVKKFNAEELAGGLHWHTCTECKRTYGDVCRAANQNGRCRVCQHNDLTPFIQWRLPRACCTGLEVITDHELLRTGRLAGPGPWFHCTTCWRAHGVARPEIPDA